jgi:hypothetical protein
MTVTMPRTAAATSDYRPREHALEDADVGGAADGRQGPLRAWWPGSPANRRRPLTGPRA